MKIVYLVILGVASATFAYLVLADRPVQQTTYSDGACVGQIPSSGQQDMPGAESTPVQATQTTNWLGEKGEGVASKRSGEIPESHGRSRRSASDRTFQMRTLLQRLDADGAGFDPADAVLELGNVQSQADIDTLISLMLQAGPVGQVAIISLLDQMIGEGWLSEDQTLAARKQFELIALHSRERRPAVLATVVLIMNADMDWTNEFGGLLVSRLSRDFRLTSQDTEQLAFARAQIALAQR